MKFFTLAVLLAALHAVAQTTGPTRVAPPTSPLPNLTPGAVGGLGPTQPATTVAPVSGLTPGAVGGLTPNASGGFTPNAQGGLIPNAVSGFNQAPVGSFNGTPVTGLSPSQRAINSRLTPLVTNAVIPTATPGVATNTTLTPSPF